MSPTITWGAQTLGGTGSVSSWRMRARVYLALAERFFGGVSEGDGFGVVGDDGLVAVGVRYEEDGEFLVGHIITGQCDASSLYSGPRHIGRRIVPR